MARGKLSGRPNQPAPAGLENERAASDVTSRGFTSPAKGSAYTQPPPRNAGHSVNRNPWKYAKGGKVRHAGRIP